MRVDPCRVQFETVFLGGDSTELRGIQFLHAFIGGGFQRRVHQVVDDAGDAFSEAVECDNRLVADYIRQFAARLPEAVREVAAHLRSRQRLNGVMKSRTLSEPLQCRILEHRLEWLLGHQDQVRTVRNTGIRRCQRLEFL